MGKAIRKSGRSGPAAVKALKWAAAWIAGVLVISILAIGILRIVTYQENHITDPNGVDEGIYTELGGQQQYLLIRGRDVNNPLIIWLHGGPGGADAYTTYVFEQQLTDRYTFVNWEQRGCGRTYYRNKDQDPTNETATFDQTQTDLDELVDYLCGRFHQEKVILIGHSYGTAVGSRYALEHPEKVAAYIGVGQLVSAIEGETSSYENALQQAEAAGDDTTSLKQAWQEYLAGYRISSMLKVRSLTGQYHVSEKSSRNSLWLTIKSPYLGFDNARWLIKEVSDVEAFITLNQSLFSFAAKADIREYGLQYAVPVGFISGAQDWTTPVACTEAYFNTITAPQKQMAQIPGCGHYPQYEDTEAFCKTLVRMLDSLLKQGS